MCLIYIVYVVISYLAAGMSLLVELHGIIGVPGWIHHDPWVDSRNLGIFRNIFNWVTYKLSWFTKMFLSFLKSSSTQNWVTYLSFESKKDKLPSFSLGSRPGDERKEGEKRPRDGVVHAAGGQRWPNFRTLWSSFQTIAKPVCYAVCCHEGIRTSHTRLLNWIAFRYGQRITWNQSQHGFKVLLLMCQNRSLGVTGNCLLIIT